MKLRLSASLIRGTVVLTIFAFLGKALGALFKISLTNLVGSQGMGIYGLVFPIFVFFEILASNGLTLGLTVNIAKNKQNGEDFGYKRYAFRLIVISALISGIFIICLSQVFSNLQGGAVSAFLYVEVACCVVIVSILGYYKAVIRGYEAFKLYSITEVIEDITKIVFALFLAFLLNDFGVEASIAGVFGGVIISGLISIIILKLFGKSYYLPRNTISLSKAEKNNFLKFSVIATFSALIVPALQLVDSILVVRLLGRLGLSTEVSTSLFGLSRGSVSALLNLPAFLLVSFEFLLLPSLSRSKKEESKDKTSISLVLAFFVSLPFSLAYLIFPSEILNILYGGALSSSEIIIAKNLLMIGSLSLVFSALSGIIMVSLESDKKTFVPFIASVVAGIFKIVFLIVFVPKLSIYGAELSSLLFVLVEATIVFVYAFIKRIFSRPKHLWIVALFWAIVLGLVFLWYKVMINVFSELWALVFAFGITTISFVVLMVLVCIILKKNRILKIFKKSE